MTRPAHAPFDPESFLCHAGKVATLTRTAEVTICDLVRESLGRYLENWDETFGRESTRLSGVIENLDRALAAIITDEWTFDPDDGYAPFHDEASAFAWLSGKGENPDVGEPGGYFERESNWTVRSLWNVRKEVETQYWDLVAWDKARWKLHWTRAPETTANLPSDLQELIHDLCQIWHDHVDEQLGLPRKDPNPDNPLLRFIDACLVVPLGDQRPPKKSVLDFVVKRIRPAIREADAESVREEERRRFKRVDLLPIPFD
ncbi:hypothetical protein [Mesorhizobium sp. A623]